MTSAQAVHASPPLHTRQSQKPKRASTLADQIESDVLKSGWPVGSVLGSEPDLIDRYQVSRAVFREAVRLLEQREVAQMRRGPGGGLVVTAPEVSAVRQAASTLLRYQQVDIGQLSEARVNIELACLRLVVDRVDEDDITYLRDLLDEEANMIVRGGETSNLRNFHAELAALSRNKPMSLFVSILTELEAEFAPHIIRDQISLSKEALPEAAANESHRAHAAIVDAVIIGDLGLAAHRMRRHLLAILEFTSEYQRQPDE
jgi:DNA-binding FadR family transcriptional regulator